MTGQFVLPTGVCAYLARRVKEELLLLAFQLSFAICRDSNSATRKRIDTDQRLRHALLLEGQADQIGTELKVCEGFDESTSEKKNNKQKRRDGRLHMEGMTLQFRAEFHNDRDLGYIDDR